MATIGGLADAAFKAQRNFLTTASKSKKPADKVPISPDKVYQLTRYIHRLADR